MKGKRILALALIAALCLALGGVATAATVYVNATINLRSGPGLVYDRIGNAVEGQEFEYLGKTVTDDRGVDWYCIAYGKGQAWVSSKYTELVLDGYEVDWTKGYSENALKDYVEVADYYLMSLNVAAAELGLSNYRYVETSEVPRQFSDGALTIMGYNVVEAFALTGPGYTVFGAAVGMDVETAREKLTAAGLVEYGGFSWGTLVFEHPAEAGGFSDEKIFDGCVNLEISNGAVQSIDWSYYTG